MVNAHEITLSADKFDTFITSDYIILQASDIEVNDYILFKRADTDPEQFRMTKVREIVSDDGLKDGYSLLKVSML